MPEWEYGNIDWFVINANRMKKPVTKGVSELFEIHPIIPVRRWKEKIRYNPSSTTDYSVSMFLRITPTQEDLKELWKDVLVIFDGNKTLSATATGYDYDRLEYVSVVPYDFQILDKFLFSEDMRALKEGLSTTENDFENSENLCLDITSYSWDYSYRTNSGRPFERDLFGSVIPPLKRKDLYYITIWQHPDTIPYFDDGSGTLYLYNALMAAYDILEDWYTRIIEVLQRKKSRMSNIHSDTNKESNTNSQRRLRWW